jgi:hypothetical protein
MSPSAWTVAWPGRGPEAMKQVADKRASAGSSLGSADAWGALFQGDLVRYRERLEDCPGWLVSRAAWWTAAAGRGLAA